MQTSTVRATNNIIITILQLEKTWHVKVMKLVEITQLFITVNFGSKLCACVCIEL